jgi:hypothetical protein
MTPHTPEQWRELVERLTALRNDPTESTARRERAEAILASVRRNPDAQIALRPPPAPPRVSDWDWLG